MSAQYEKALQLWGAKKLQQKFDAKGQAPLMVDIKSVTVEMDFDEGYDCCGGSDPQCYCSLAESPSAGVKISGIVSQHNYPAFQATTSIDHDEFDFVKILGEIVEAGDGVLTREDR